MNLEDRKRYAETKLINQKEFCENISIIYKHIDSSFNSNREYIDKLLSRIEKLELKLDAMDKRIDKTYDTLFMKRHLSEMLPSNMTVDVDAFLLCTNCGIRIPVEERGDHKITCSCGTIYNLRKN